MRATVAAFPPFVTRPRRVRWIVLGVAALAAIAAVLLAPWLVERTVELNLSLHNVGPALALEWAGADGQFNGAWLNVAEAQADAAPPVRVRQKLPIYALSALRLRWTTAGPGARLTLHQAAVCEGVYGVTVRHRPLAAEVEPAGEHATTLAADGSLALTAPAGELLLVGRTTYGRTVVIVGALLSALGAALLTLALIGVARVPWTAAVRWAGLPGVVLLVIVGLRIWLAAWAPLFYSWDSFDYLCNGMKLLRTGSFAHFTPLRPPGYSSFLAVLLMARTSPTPIIMAAQALLGLASAVLIYRVLRRFTSRAWAGLGLLLVGADAQLLTFEHYALTETALTFLMTLLAFLVTSHFVRDLQRRRAGWLELLSGVVVAFVTVVAFYLRSNVAPLLVLIPLVLFWSAWVQRPRRLARFVSAALALAVIVLCVPPSSLRWRSAQSAEFTPVKRYESLTQLGRLDVDQTAFFNAGPQGELVQKDHDEHRPPMLKESIARYPLRLIPATLDAIGYQLGIVLDPRAREFVGSAQYYSLPLRGVPGGINTAQTNFVHLAKESEGYPLVHETYPDLEHSTARLAEFPACPWFDRLFRGHELILPFFGVLTLVAGPLAWRRRCHGLLALWLLGMANVAVFVNLLSPTDRYSLPFRLMLVPLAVYALQQVVAWARPAEPLTSYRDLRR